MTKLTKHQTKTYGPRFYKDHGVKCCITATVRYDDECNNGHNTFSITGEIKERVGPRWREYSGGCLHDEITKHFPELAPYIKWHLCSTDGPLYYIDNTLYWLGYSGWCDGKSGSPPNLEHARSTAIWPDMPESFLAPQSIKGTEAGQKVQEALKVRYAVLMNEFRAAVESLGFIW